MTEHCCRNKNAKGFEWAGDLNNFSIPFAIHRPSFVKKKSVFSFLKLLTWYEFET